ncbi:hypothetical protein SISNIDRAFT_251480 [Sistotremastrum niveocremeum HHB9708]|uniref:Uncharacterized protein n=1 Tax=Sistotremastrum niveocremeum HHB9708 TaxID=1314777 RepID=A0A164Z0G4_9AGAM|nr:hypothetical protein SISNIDRAFT_251480 [Sistotremastrum niveocremeum HHB9708]
MIYRYQDSVAYHIITLCSASHFCFYGVFLRKDNILYIDPDVPEDSRDSQRLAIELTGVVRSWVHCSCTCGLEFVRHLPQVCNRNTPELSTCTNRCPSRFEYGFYGSEHLTLAQKV